jgi:hypothetical protein
MSMQVAAGVGFVVVVAITLGLVLGDQGIAIGFGLGQFGFGLAGAVFGEAFQCFGLGQLLGKGLKLLAAGGGFGWDGAGDGIAVKGELAEGAACTVGAVVAGNPVQQVKEFFGELRRASRVGWCWRRGRPGCRDIGCCANFGEEARAEVVFKAGFVDQVGELDRRRGECR